MEINETLRGQEVTTTMSYDPIGLIKWQLFVNMEKSFEQQSAMGVGDGTEVLGRRVAACYTCCKKSMQTLSLLPGAHLVTVWAVVSAF